MVSDTVTAGSAADTAHVTDTNRGGKAYRFYVVFVLFIAYTFSAIDSRILTLLVIPIQDDLQLTDFQMSLLQGFAFALLYSLSAIPIGRIVDGTSSRVRLMTGGVGFWSFMTIICGLSNSFGALFFARVGVGVGEATLSPSAYSVISDYFDRTRRALAISFYAIGYSVGGGLALILGAVLLDYFTASGGADFWILGKLAPWQAVFVCVGLPGFIIMLMVATIREPVRRELATGYDASIPLKIVWQYLVEHWRVYGMLIGSLALIAMVAFGTALWYPTFLMRTYGMSPGAVGATYGAIMIIGGTSGTLCGGWLSGWLMRRGRTDANMSIVLGTTILKGLPLILSPLMPTPFLALSLMAIGTFIGQAAQGVMLSAIQDVTPNQMRGQVTALSLLSVNLIGLGLGASFVAAITDFGFGDPMAVRYSISIAGAVILPIIVIVILLGMPHYRAALANISRASEAS
ncbi:MFS transporter [Parasphingorhabdus sp. JC815]|uniref:MFS transporter n=1 Tax=Parasphingorhabdus sp. JC815 TaxID=3232140 RepID=UPI0034584044